MMRARLPRLRRALLGAAALVGALGGCGDDHIAARNAAPGTDPAVIGRGRALARAADCVGCHTAPGGAPFAGGAPLKSPFGVFYGTNITPDKRHGIGRWSADQFYAALHDGVAPDRMLYPAMPYTSYRSLSRADSDALYAYLMQTKPAATPNRAHELAFPYNLRFGLHFWNLLFLQDTLPDASRGGSPAYLRGRYLVNTLGHCAECHTPRGMLGQLSEARPLRGSTLARIGAPDISPQGLSTAGWTGADLNVFLGTGVAPQGSAYGEMYEVVHLSTRHLSTPDLAAMTTYLLGDQPLPPQVLKPSAVTVGASAALDAGRRTYVAVCAGCHGFDGGGKPDVAVAMKGNTTVRAADPHNLIAVTLDGIAAQEFSPQRRMQAMPGFAQLLNDQQVADLCNFLRQHWGGQAAPVGPDQVRALR